MEGKALLRELRELLQETSTGSFLNDRTSYDYLFEAALDFNLRTHFLTSTQSIAVTAGDSAYDLNPDFSGMALTDTYNRPFIKYITGGTDYFIYPADYSAMVLENSSTSKAVPDGYAIKDASLASNISGSCTSTSAASNGESLLVDSAAPFAGVAVGDFVHNISDGSDGIVMEVVSSSTLKVALFEGTNNDWTSGDDYIITPQTRHQIVLNPAPSQSATITVYYVQRPSPVYSPYRSYRLPFEFKAPLVKYAAFLYKYRDREPSYGDALYKHYDVAVRKVTSELRRAQPQRNRMTVNTIKLSPNSNPIGGWRY